MIMRALLIATILLGFSFNAFALTWDEPWHDKVVRDSDAFILGKIIRVDEKEGIYIRVLKSISGVNVPAELKITDFYLLKICSTSGDQYPEFPLNGIDSCYFFLKINNDTFSIATPTTGFAKVIDGKVVATYRHSYHQTSVPVNDYEKSQEAIFNFYHGKKYDESWIKNFVTGELSIKPAGFEKDEIERFFSQHVALELVFHLQLKGYFDLLQPFIEHNENRHNQISAARALKNYSSVTTNNILMNVIKSSSDDDFLKVICLWSLSGTNTAEMQEQLKQILKTASNDGGGFGGNIMDHRVCTRFPSVKAAIEELVSQKNSQLLYPLKKSSTSIFFLPSNCNSSTCT